MLIPFWIPVLLTLFGLLYIFLLGRFIPGWRDEGLVFLVIVVVWLVFGVLDIITKTFQTIFGGRIGSFLFAALAIIGVALFVRWKRKNA